MTQSSDNAADLELLSLANEKGKFAIQLGMALDSWVQHAFERGIDRQWFTLVDVAPIAAMPGNKLMKIFRLTHAGHLRLATLRMVTEIPAVPHLDKEKLT